MIPGSIKSINMSRANVRSAEMLVTAVEGRTGTYNIWIHCDSDGFLTWAYDYTKRGVLRPEGGQGWTYFWLYIDEVRVKLHHGKCALSMALS